MIDDERAARRHAPATMRNRDAIAALLAEWLPERGLVLEIASGTGEHCAWFAERFSALHWQPSDPDPLARASIASWTNGMTNVAAPIELDAATPDWPVARADALLCINMVHISPWEATLGLMRGAASLLPPGAPLILYGPYRRAGVPTAPSNEAFDRSLRERDASWRLREVGDVVGAAHSCGLALEMIAEMPANNLSLLFRRRNE